MPNGSISPSAVSSEFFKPAFDFLADSKCRRNCPALPDELWVEAGIRRCLGLFQSGRDFLQDLADRHAIEILSTTFFESLKSKRRLSLLSDILVRTPWIGVENSNENSTPGSVLLRLSQPLAGLRGPGRIEVKIPLWR